MRSVFLQKSGAHPLCRREPGTGRAHEAGVQFWGRGGQQAVSVGSSIFAGEETAQVSWAEAVGLNCLGRAEMWCWLGRACALGPVSVTRGRRGRGDREHEASGSEGRYGEAHPTSPGSQALSMLPSLPWGVHLKVDSWSQMAARAPAIWPMFQTGSGRKRGRLSSKESKEAQKSHPAILFTSHWLAVSSPQGKTRSLSPLPMKCVFCIIRAEGETWAGNEQSLPQAGSVIPMSQSWKLRAQRD